MFGGVIAGGGLAGGQGADIGVVGREEQDTNDGVDAVDDDEDIGDRTSEVYLSSDGSVGVGVREEMGVRGEALS